MNKQDNITSILAQDTGWNKSQLTKMNAKDVAGLSLLLNYEDASNDPEGEPLEATNGSKVQQSYRNKYAEIAKAQGRKATTASGKATLNNGDQLALLLENADHVTTCAIADTLLGLATGTNLALYTTDRIGRTHPKTGAELKALNNGMVRMNAGNKIRSFIKKMDAPEDGIAQVRDMIAE